MAGKTIDDLPSAERLTAESICKSLSEVMDALLACVAKEADCVRAGRLFAASELKSRESTLVRRYQQEMRRMDGCAAELEKAAPAAVARIRREHEGFRALLQINMAALASARELADLQLEEVRSRPGIHRAA